MKLKITLVRSSDQSSPVKTIRERVTTQPATNAQMISAKFSSFLNQPTLDALKNQKPKRFPVEVEKPKPAMANGLLERTLGWLKGNYATPKRLRVLETVTLGEKRMVAVIQADGCRFLVGGGPSGVSLLTPLDQMQKPNTDFSSASGLRELAG